MTKVMWPVTVQSWGGAICKEKLWRRTLTPAHLPSPHAPSPMKGEGALITLVTPSGACSCALSMHKAPSPMKGEGAWGEGA